MICDALRKNKCGSKLSGSQIDSYVLFRHRELRKYPIIAATTRHSILLVITQD